MVQKHQLRMQLSVDLNCLPRPSTFRSGSTVQQWVGYPKIAHPHVENDEGKFSMEPLDSGGALVHLSPHQGALK